MANRSLIRRLRTALALLSQDGEDYQVEQSRSVDTVFADGKRPVLVILDTRVHHWIGSGCQLRRDSNVPILVLADGGSFELREPEVDIIVGLEAFADSVCGRDSEPRYLKAIIKALIRRAKGEWETQSPTAGVIEAGPIRMDTRNHTVSVAGKGIQISLREWGLLGYLIRHRGYVVSYSSLLEAVWKRNIPPSGKRALAVYITRVQRKIGDDEREKHERLIRNIYGVGYKFVSPEAL